MSISSSPVDANHVHAGSPPDSGSLHHGPQPPRHPASLLEAISTSRKGGKTQVEYVERGRQEQTKFGFLLETMVVRGEEEAFNAEEEEGNAHTSAAKEAAGYAVAWRDDELSWSLLVERARLGGPGLLVNKRGLGRKRLLVECPHTFFDAKTLDVGLALFESCSALALLYNTVHRGDVKDGAVGEDVATASRSGGLATDMAHNRESLFQTAHESLLRCGDALGGKIVTVQVHGFRDEFLPEADVVVSGASTPAVDWVPTMARHLRAAFPDMRVLHSPTETPKLTAARNVQGQLCRERGLPFFHIEICKTWRWRLTVDSEGDSAPGHSKTSLQAFCSAVGNCVDEVLSGAS